MIKVLNIITDTNIGGAGRILVQYLRCFDRDRFDVVNAVPSGSALIPLIEAEGYTVIETKYGHDKSYERGAVGELRRIIKDVRPDIVHTHSSLAGKIAAYLCGVKSRIYTRHCVFDMPKRLTTFPGKQINGFVNNTLSTAIVAVANAAADNLTETGVDPDKITVIINGVEPMPERSESERVAFRSSLGIGEDEFVCLISARLEVYKGHSYLIDTAKIVKDSDCDRPVRFILMGDGAERENLERRAAELGVSDIVMFTGFVKNVADYYNIADISLNCSWGTEASSLALAEGMSLGRPAVVTDFGGNPYMITDGVNGLVVPKRDSAAMAEAILKIVRSPELYRTLSDGARSEYKSKFTSDVMTRNLEALYEREMEHVRGRNKK